MATSRSCEVLVAASLEGVGVKKAASMLPLDPRFSLDEIDSANFLVAARKFAPLPGDETWGQEGEDGSRR